MLQALWSASSGMQGQQTALDNVANNLANINTNGYKKSRVEFQDLLYSQMRTPGRTTLRGETVPTGYQIGNGVRVAGTQVLFSQGNLQQTDNPLDMAIEGKAFFTVRMPDGTNGYTRDGAFKLDADGLLVTSEGYPVLGMSGGNLVPITFASPEQVNINSEGRLFEMQQVRKLDGYKFTDEDKLEMIENGYFRQTNASGRPTLEGEGRDEKGGTYFQVLMPDGKVAFTKETNVALDGNGRMTTKEGYPFVPEVYLPTGSSAASLSEDGTVSAAVETGQLAMAVFTNPAGLNKLGSNTYIATEKSGEAMVAEKDEFSIISATLESSNVDMAEEMINMMIAQRAYELSSRSIRTTDEMLGMANQLLRR